MRAPSEMSAADTDMLSELMEEFGLTQGPPHVAYGKDAKHLCRTAERNQKARLASTHDVYYFCATNLPQPRSFVTASQIVKDL